MSLELPERIREPLAEGERGLEQLRGVGGSGSGSPQAPREARSPARREPRVEASVLDLHAELAALGELAQRARTGAVVAAGVRRVELLDRGVRLGPQLAC